MKRTPWIRLLVTGVSACSALAWVSTGRGADGVRTVERDWVEEAEFDADETLHAMEWQTIVLDLEDAASGNGRYRSNRVRFLLEKKRSFSFCIADHDRFLVDVALKRLGPQGGWPGRRSLLLHKRGQACRPVALEPGRYELTIRHDTRDIPPGGRRAFLYDPEAPSLLGSDLSSGLPDFMAFTASNGKIVTSYPQTAENDIITANSPDVWDTETWVVGPFPNTSGHTLSTVFTDGDVKADGRAALLAPELGPVWLYNRPEGVNPTDVEFLFHDQANWKFTMDAWVTVTAQGGSSSTIQGRAMRDSATSQLEIGGTYETFTAKFKGFNCSAGCGSGNLPLGAGEVALFSECNYKGEGAASITDVAAFVAFDVPPVGGTAPPQIVRSLRLGPGTFVELYDDYGFSGNVQGYSEDQSCLTAPAEVAAFKVITNARTFIIDTNSCINCSLGGINLSGLDLSEGVFDHSTFTNANLASTKFNKASLTGADLSGATMTSATFNGANLSAATITGGTLASANFQGANLSGAAIHITAASDLSQTDFSAGAVLHCISFRTSNLTDSTFDAAPDILRDHSCPQDLSSTTLTFDTLPVADWRYFDLSHSTMTGVPDTLSTGSAPLDLSGIGLNGVQWLAGKTLDAVNLGCFPREAEQTTICPTPAGTRACSSLQGINLVKASLKHACMDQASMEGAFLSQSNLDGADMGGVKLKAIIGSNPATLEGAFMRNVNLSEADLTGVNANNVDFFTAAGGTADATDVTAPGADFSGSYLAFADFSGDLSDLQSTNWSNAMLLGANFEQADLSTNTSGGVNSGTNTKFTGAYMQGVNLAEAILENVNFSSTYWDALGAGGKMTFLIPKQNLGFTGYWKALALPECPPALTYNSGNPPPSFATNSSNTCPNGGPGPCDGLWDQPEQSIDTAFFKSADASASLVFPQDPTASAEDQCSSSFSAPNPQDYCWITSNNPSQCPENALGVAPD
jgi:uncharacterized protein YjbI with pentapeptide repeats